MDAGRISGLPNNSAYSVASDEPENLNVMTILKRLKTSRDLGKPFCDSAQSLNQAVAK
jgi:hypothetical protein